MKTYIKGNYRDYIYKSEQGYVIGIFKIKETNSEILKDYIEKTITFTGTFFDLNKNDLYTFYGEEFEHPKYGLQFKVTEYERLKPNDKDGIVAFLSSDLFKGIGEKMAKDIVNYLGEDALDKILENPECLLQVQKVSSKKAKTIYETLSKYEESHKVVVYLTELGFNMNDALSLYNVYKQNTILKIEHNIYGILDDIPEISFLKIDEIALRSGTSKKDERRMQGLLVYMAKTVTFETGNTYFFKEELKEKMEKFLEFSLSLDEYEIYLQAALDLGKLVLEEDRYSLKEIYDSEEYILKKINILLKRSKEKNKRIETNLKLLEESNGICYNEEQKEAIQTALENNITIITGGPGTGKTTIIKAIVDLYTILKDLSYEQQNMDIALLAPTGRASKRMSEATLLPAMTIHRFLKWNKEKNCFSIDEFHKESAKLVIIDEVSMIDTSLLASLLKGLMDDVKIIFVGDHDQLPSVGPGNVLKDFIESKKVDTIFLKKLYRQDENSYITTLASEIRNGNIRKNFLDMKSDYAFLECRDISKNLKNLCIKMKEKGLDFKNIQVMAPMYAGAFGIDALNKELQSVWNPKDLSKKEINYGDVCFREQDKVLQLVNMPEENVFNGDIGVITRIDTVDKKNTIFIDFDGNEVSYQAKDFYKIRHGFITSIHKSQGSEFDMVIMPISMSYKRMLYKKLIYTGITRAKRKLILLGDKDAFLYATKNEKEQVRKTYLKEKLKRLA